MITYCTWSGEIPERSRAARIATSPSLVAGRSLSPPSRRPIGVRAPLTITEVMVAPTGKLNAGSVQTSAMTETGLLRIDHVGIAVTDLDEAIGVYERIFGMRCVHVEENAEQGVREAMLAVGPSDGYGCSTSRPGAARPARGSTSCIPRTPAASSWSWWSRRASEWSRRAGESRGFVHKLVPSGSVPLLLVSNVVTMERIRDAILSAEHAADPAGELAGIAGLPVPDSYCGVVVRAEETEIFAGMDNRDKDPRKSLHVQEVPTPELGPGEALVAVMASAVNYNTVWTSIFEPIPTFAFLKRYGGFSDLGKRHDLPYHVVGSDAAGVVLRVGAGVTKWKPGDEVVAHCLSVELEEAAGHDDTLLDPQQRIWGFETNFGGLAELALVKANQLMPKPRHLTWEEAACPGLVNSTAYRQLVSHHGAQMKQGDTVLIWGASGGLGSYATQLALGGGAVPVCVVSSPEKAELCRRMGAELVIDRAAEGFRFWRDEHTQDPAEWRRFGERIRELTGGDDPDIVFEHPGRETFGASVFVAKRGGTVVTCASTSGFLHQYDNRYLWMHLKRIVGSHFANYREAWEANRLIAKGKIHPTLSKTYPMEQAGQAAYEVHRNAHQGKVGVRCLAPVDGLGVRDQQLRARNLEAINRFRGQ